MAMCSKPEKLRSTVKPPRSRPIHALSIPISVAVSRRAHNSSLNKNAAAPILTPMTDLSLPSVSSALLAEADRVLLAPSDLDHAKLSQVLAAIHARDVDFADLYFQHARFESWNLEESIVKSGSFNIDRGVGVRAVSGDKQAYAYSDDISLAALEEAAVAVRAIVRQGQSTSTPL